MKSLCYIDTRTHTRAHSIVHEGFNVSVLLYTVCTEYIIVNCCCCQHTYKQATVAYSILLNRKTCTYMSFMHFTSTLEYTQTTLSQYVSCIFSMYFYTLVGIDEKPFFRRINIMSLYNFFFSCFHCHMPICCCFEKITYFLLFKQIYAQF